MATTSTSTAVAVAESVFTEPERRALAGFLAGYTGLTCEAYALDLRQFASWRRPLPWTAGSASAAVKAIVRPVRARRGRTRAEPQNGPVW
jgi:hypothetical protein